MPRSIGWYNYIYGDNAAGQRPDQERQSGDDRRALAYSIAKMKEYGIVDSGDTVKLGIGAMTDARMKSFFDKMVAPASSKGGHRLPEGLHPAIREQGRRARSPAEEIDASIVSSAVAMTTSAQASLRRSPRFVARRRQALRQRRRRRWTGSISTSGAANSCRCSGRPAAASRRRCASSPA